LTRKNDGKSPAFIEGIYGRAHIVQNPSKQVSPEPPKLSDLADLGDFEPLGPGAERSRVLQMWCKGQMGNDDFVSVYVVVVYRDIFGKKRTTSMGYTAVDADQIYRQAVFPKRNANT
jgi:hypothetical protein